jgi:putative hemolysin
MKIYTLKNTLFSSIFALSLLGACRSEPEPGESVAIANPASEYCITRGGRLEIVKEEAGEKGMCHLPDGTVVEEWELFRRENPPQ